MLDLAPPKRDESESETESESDNSVVVGQNEKLGNKMVSNSNFSTEAKLQTKWTTLRHTTGSAQRLKTPFAPDVRTYVS